MNGSGAFDDLARLRQLFLSHEPPGLPARITPIEFGRRMFSGTTVPVIGGAEFRTTESGLIVPASAAPDVAPFDLVKTFITPDEISGQALSDEVALVHLRRLPFAAVLIFVASTLSRWRNPRFGAAENDRYFARQWFGGQTQTIVLNLLRDERRGLVAPQALLVLLKMALIEHADPTAEVESTGDIVIALLAIMQNLGSAASSGSDETVLRDKPGNLGREIIANQLFNSSVEVAGVLARYVRTWVEMPLDFYEDPRVVDLSRSYLEATGVAVQDLAIVGIALIAGAWQGRMRFDLHYFSSLGWEQSRLVKVLELVSTDMHRLRERVVAETGDHGMEWAFSTFERYPLVRIGHADFCLIDPLLILRRVFGWLPVFDVRSALRAQGSRESQKKAKHFEGCVRHLAEQYALEVISSIVQYGARRRLYSESQLRDAFGKKGVRVADCAIDYGDAWIVLEVTTSQLTRESVSGVSGEHLMADLGKLVEKAEQLDSTITAIRNNEHDLTSGTEIARKRFFPVLVVTEGFPANPVSLQLLREEVARVNYLRESDTAELEILDTAELELIEATHKDYGISFRSIIEAKGRSGLRRASVRDYILVELQLTPNFSNRVLELAERVFEPALEALSKPAPDDEGHGK